MADRRLHSQSRMMRTSAIGCAAGLMWLAACAASGDASDNGGGNGSNQTSDAGGRVDDGGSVHDAATGDASSDSGGDGIAIDSATWTPVTSDFGDGGQYGDGDGGLLLQGNVGESCSAWMGRVHPDAVSFKTTYDFVGGAIEGERHGRAGNACAYITYFSSAHDSYSCGYFDSDTAPAAADALFGARPVAYCATGLTAGGSLTNVTYFSRDHVSTSEGIPPHEQGWKDVTGQSDEGENCRTWLARTGAGTPQSDGTIWTRVIVDGVISQWPLCATMDTTYAATPTIGDVCSTGRGPFGESKYFAIGSCETAATSSEGAVRNRTQTR